jgi:ABC-type transport system involved in multi-copper enzyme maturation permease subunit
MNKNIRRALYEDALQQVLDNRVFRLLVILVLCLVAPTFLIGFHPDHISLLWFWDYNYQELTLGLGIPIPNDVRPDELLIKGMQTVVIDGLAGMIGIIFCIAATAFFVPRMLEKGAADTLFSKPVSRATLLLTRYCSGLLFVGVLSIALVGGMYLGFALVSGYTDTGFLWSAITLIYLYAILHAFSVLVATITRSSVAAILLVLMMFSFSGCIHRAWVFKEYSQETTAFKVLRAEMQEKGDIQEDDEDSTAIVILTNVLNGLHYTLPKTGDATTITKMLREAVEGMGPALEDTEADVILEDNPTGMILMGSSTPDFSSPVTWVPEDQDADPRQKVFILRRDREQAPSESGETERRLVSSRVASSFLDELEERDERGELAEAPEKERRMFGGGRRGNQLIVVRWAEGSPDDALRRARFFFHFSDWLYQVDLSMPREAMSDENYEEWESDFFYGLRLGKDQFLGPMQWYEGEFGWNSPWKYNAYFSIFSSLSFALLCLLFSVFRLNRYDF